MTRSIARIAKLERERGTTPLSAMSDATLEARVLSLADTVGYRWADLFPNPASADLTTMIATVRRDIDASV